MVLKVMSLNMKGLNSPVKRDGHYRQEILTSQADIACIRETHFHRKKPPKCSHQKFPIILSASLEAKKCGVMIAIKNMVSFKQEKLLQKVKSEQKGSLLVCGDFNKTGNPILDCSPNRQRNNTKLAHLLHREKLFDSWRCHHQGEKDFTFFSPVHNMYSRIDLILTDKWVLQRIQKTSIGHITWSDHAPVFLEIQETYNYKESGLWRLNSYWLNHDQYFTSLKTNLEEYFQFNDTNDTSHVTLWMAHKAYMRGIAMQLNARIRKEKALKQLNLLNQLYQLEYSNKLNPSRTISKQIKEVQNELQELFAYKQTIVYNKMRLNYYCQGDQAKQRIPYLINKQNVKEQNPKIIADIFAEYYSELYNLKSDISTPQPSQDIIDSFFAKLTFPKITPGRTV
ncbi:hypothetical protein XELAEV_18014801mg [Xenopus laevis]|uniref:exodeoxyribonuclease III n=1 Tax=Xenopus laevis TaxID=8355 RepID=A0A974DJG2_XENLA|nr:hypothetical protein XELAEV_18014801mg [Xenopus laevis]